MEIPLDPILEMRALDRLHSAYTDAYEAMFGQAGAQAEQLRDANTTGTAECVELLLAAGELGRRLRPELRWNDPGTPFDRRP